MTKSTLKKILFFDHTATMGGGEISLLHLIQHMDRDRFLPMVVLSSEGTLRAKLEESNVQTHLLPLSPEVLETRKDTLGTRSLFRVGTVLRTILYIFRLARFLKAHRPDILHTNSLKSDVIGGIAGHMMRIPVIWHVRDRISEDYLPKSVVRAFRWLCRVLPDYIITNSAATLETLHLPSEGQARVIYNGIVEKNVSVVHDGIVPERVAPAQSSNKTWLIGLVGRITAWKGQHIFIDAAAQVHKLFPQVHFQIIGSAMFGESKYEEQIRAQAQSLGLSECMEFTGFRSDVPELIQKLDILVHASTTGEPFGQVVVEGMIAGKPVVATNGGGVPEIVQDGISGLLVPMGDSDAMAQAIIRLLNNPELAAAMGNAARQRVHEHFTIQHTVHKVQNVYTDISDRYRHQSLLVRLLHSWG